MIIKVLRRDITRFLTELNYAYSLSLTPVMRITMIRNLDNNQRYYLTIEVDDTESFVNINTFGLVTVKHSIFKGILFQTLLTMGEEEPLVRWKYNHKTGDLNAGVHIPLIDNGLTFRQFNYCLSILIKTVEILAMPRITAILANGSDPEDKNKVLRIIEDLSPEMLQNLQTLLNTPIEDDEDDEDKV